MSEANLIDRPVIPVAWAMRRADGLVLDVICPDEHERHEGDYTSPLYALSPDQVDVLEKCEYDNALDARDLSKCDHHETCKHVEP